MDGKKSVIGRSLALALAFFILYWAPYMPPTVGNVASAQTTTVGASNGLKANGVNSMTVIPNQVNTPSCFTINVNSVTATVVVAANAKRAAIWITNTSSVPLTTVANKVDNRPPTVWLFFSSTVPLANSAANAYKLGQSMAAIPLTGNIGGTSVAGAPSNSTFAMSGVTVYRGGIWAVAEQSTDTSNAGGAAGAAWVQGCEFNP